MQVIAMQGKREWRTYVDPLLLNLDLSLLILVDPHQIVSMATPKTEMMIPVLAYIVGCSFRNTIEKGNMKIGATAVINTVFPAPINCMAAA